ncbi:MAG: tetratricopeptide repeat protein [Opitutus sp.]|nr:tetratricopeptide repeat protein [Opitutus sp.]
MISRRLVLALGLATAACAAPLDDAIKLYDAKQFPAARAAFEHLTAAEPANAVACYYLAQTLRRRGDATGLEEASKWFEKASTLAPTNATYLAEHGTAMMLLAQKKTSISAATRGRDLLEKSLALDPANVDARETLYQYYQQAPWPIGSSSKATAQLEEIRQRDPDRATVILVSQKVSAKDYPAAFQLLDATLAKNPANYTALYFYGRTAAISGLNLERGRACLEQCLTLTPPSSTAPAPTFVWNRLGQLQEKLGHRTEARTAYESALKLDPTNQPAADALAKLK